MMRKYHVRFGGGLSQKCHQFRWQLGGSLPYPGADYEQVLDGLFAFHVSAEDAAYLAEELGGGLDAQDLLEVGHYRCYARLSDVHTGERLPTFSVELDAPPESDEQLAIRLGRLSAERYGRDALDVELDLQAAFDRIRGPRRTTEATDADGPAAPPEPAAPGTGVPGASGVVVGAEVPGE